jgi:hypothetical protein
MGGHGYRNKPFVTQSAVGDPQGRRRRIVGDGALDPVQLFPDRAGILQASQRAGSKLGSGWHDVAGGTGFQGAGGAKGKLTEAQAAEPEEVLAREGFLAKPRPTARPSVTTTIEDH